MKYIKNLVINIFQIDIITSDIEIEDFTFVGANKFRDDVEEIDKDAWGPRIEHYLYEWYKTSIEPNKLDD